MAKNIQIYWSAKKREWPSYLNLSHCEVKRNECSPESLSMLNRFFPIFFLFCHYCLSYVCLRTLTFLLKLISLQVFAQYSATSNDPDHEGEFSKSKKHILRGPVVITRNPCLHPGDVRQLTAVYVAQLVHLVDCVVFPNHGPRPHPSEMAGIINVNNYFWSFSIDHQVSS